MPAYIKNILTQGSLPEIMFTVMLAGALASLTSCTIARLPVLIGLVNAKANSKHRELFLSLAFCAGLIITYTILGVLLGFITQLASKLIGISQFLYLILGLFMILGGAFFAGLIPNSSSWFSERCDQLVKGGKTIHSAFSFGVVFAFLEMPACACCGSVLLLIASMSAIKGSLVYSTAIFFAFAVGQSLPILLLGLSAGLLKKILPQTQKLESIISFVVGNILIVTGVFLLMIA